MTFLDAAGHALLIIPAGRMRITFRGSDGYGTAQREVDVPANGRVTTELASVPLGFGNSGDPGFTMLDDQLPPTVLSLRTDPALHSGLAVGDQILAIDGTPTTTFGPDGLAQLLLNHPPGPVELSIARGAKRLTVVLTLAAGQ